MSDKIRLGIIGAASIAKNRFLPALMGCDNMQFAGVASRFEKEARAICELYGGKVYMSYEALLCSSDIDAVYIPLPPALHFNYAKEALIKGKHIIVEKPISLSINEVYILAKLANQNGLAIHENYVFLFHKQLKRIHGIIESGLIGKVRFMTIHFGFPKRDKNDFRYNKKLGGGALLDCGGYTIKLADDLLGKSCKITNYQLIIEEGEVDICGSATLTNAEGVTAQVAFGMDCDYRCELRIWGTNGSLLAPRIFTSPTGYKAPIICFNNGDVVLEETYSDNQFKNSIEYFGVCIEDDNERLNNLERILRQSEFVSQILC